MQENFEDEDVKVALDEESLEMLKDIVRHGEQELKDLSAEINGDEKKEKEEDEDDEPDVQYSQWLKRGKNIFLPTDDAKKVKVVDPGFFTIKYSEKQGYYLFKKELKLDNLIQLSSPESKEVMDCIQTFWARKDKFKEYGFAYKRGILLYGAPGTGKSSIINLLAFDLITNKNGVIFTIRNSDDLEHYLTFIPEIFRVIEKDRPIITIIEDIDGLCESNRTETTLINLLDGIEQMDNVVYIATTNYLEKLSERIRNRPNRFDRRIHVGFPIAAVRREYIKFKLKASDLESFGDTEIERWVKKTKGLTISHIGEIIKSVLIMGDTFDKTLKTLEDLKKIPKSSDYNRTDLEEDEYTSGTSIGFKSR